MTDRYHLTAMQAADALGVTRATLYAYASRGELRSDPVPGRPRERRYQRADIERLKERKDARRDPSTAAARGLHWGGPVLESGITLVHHGRLFYRGRDAIALARTASVEEVAVLLWGLDEADRERLFAQPPMLSSRQLTGIRSATKDVFAAMQMALPLAAARDASSYDLRLPAVCLTGARIVRLLTTIVTRRDRHEPVHLALQRAWAPDRKAVADVIRTALVLCADHELNVSAFTARCAASAGASPYDVVSAGLATLKGFKHGGAAERVLALVAESTTPGRARTALADRLRRGESVGGFGHPMYPTGDPRATLLVELARERGDAAAFGPLRHLAKAAAEVLNDRPNLDFGLAAVTRAFALPARAPLLLFALGRTIGWMAHAIEEYATGRLIRPRARYTGPAPHDI